MPIILLFLSGIVYSLVFVASYIQGYILLTFTSVIVLNWIVLFFKYFQKKKREELRKFFYPTDEQQGKKESGFVFFTAVLTSWISPCSIWANTFGQKTWFLFYTSSTCIIAYFINIISIGISETLGYIIPTENPPITRCFHEINKFDTIKYRLFFSENHTLSEIFKICNNYEECQPAIRICSENESTSDILWNVLIPLGIGLLSISCIAALILQNLGNHYTFLKLLIKSCSIETNNFANAFYAFLKNRHLLEKNIQNELLQQMETAVVISEEKKEAVRTIFDIIDQETLTAANERVLMTNLSLLTFTTNKRSVWNFPMMHKAVEENNFTWFSFLIALGGECGAKNGINISSINMLREKQVQDKNLLDNYSFITRWLITRALQKYQELALHIAAAEGNHQEIERLIANSYDVDLKDDNNVTPLHIASENGHFEIAKILVDNLADKDLKDTYNQTPLQIAVKYGHLEIVKYLAENHADTEARDEDGLTLLMWASQKGHIKIVKILVENGAEKDANNNKNQTPLHFAVIMGHFEIVKYLVDNGADKESKDYLNQTPLHTASKNGHFEIVKHLVENGGDKEAKEEWRNRTPLHMAAKKGHFEIVKYLVENGADKEAKDKLGRTPLYLASKERHFTIVQYLKDNGAKLTVYYDYNSDSYTDFDSDSE